MQKTPDQIYDEFEARLTEQRSASLHEIKKGFWIKFKNLILDMGLPFGIISYLADKKTISPIFALLAMGFFYLRWSDLEKRRALEARVEELEKKK
jgi:hypothetical protein